MELYCYGGLREMHQSLSRRCPRKLSCQSNAAALAAVAYERVSSQSTQSTGFALR